MLFHYIIFPIQLWDQIFQNESVFLIFIMIVLG